MVIRQWNERYNIPDIAYICMRCSAKIQNASSAVVTQNNAFASYFSAFRKMVFAQMECVLFAYI